jgi:hypothetical protein
MSEENVETVRARIARVRELSPREQALEAAGSG